MCNHLLFLDLFSEELLGGGGGDHDSRRSDRYSSHRGGGGHRRRPSHRPRDDSYLDELSFSEEGFNDDLLGMQKSILYFTIICPPVFS